MTDLRERVARAICVANWLDREGHIGNDAGWEDWLSEADAAIAAGVGAVPEPFSRYDLAGDMDDHNDIEKTVAIVRLAYGWTLTDEGRLCGLVSGDMGYAITSIVISKEDLDAWAFYNYQPDDAPTHPAAAEEKAP